VAVAQVVECLPRKCRALSSRKKEERKGGREGGRKEGRKKKGTVIPNYGLVFL
jgi:hypothetical protein